MDIWPLSTIKRQRREIDVLTHELARAEESRAALEEYSDKLRRAEEKMEREMAARAEDVYRKVVRLVAEGPGGNTEVILDDGSRLVGVVEATITSDCLRKVILYIGERVWL